MILNLLRVEALRVEEMIKRSFSENASQRLLPDQQKKVIEASTVSNLEIYTSDADARSRVRSDCRPYKSSLATTAYRTLRSTTTMLRI